MTSKKKCVCARVWCVRGERQTSYYAHSQYYNTTGDLMVGLDNGLNAIPTPAWKEVLSSDVTGFLS